jgi:hypothetical protein
MLKALFWWNLLEKRKPYRDSFLYKKAIKTDICAVRFALTALFSFKKIKFLGVRFALTPFLEFICFKIIPERFALLK